jgi:peroxiredoxin Q/BCP
MIEVGKPAPQIRLPDQFGEVFDSTEIADTPIVVYFYPKDNTRGCTAQACGIRDSWSDLTEAGAVVVGVSADDVDSHAKFAAEYDLPHRLLADPGRTTIDEYGAWGWRIRPSTGERVEGVLRRTVVIDRSEIGRAHV